MSKKHCSIIINTISSMFIIMIIIIMNIVATEMLLLFIPNPRTPSPVAHLSQTIFNPFKQLTH